MPRARVVGGRGRRRPAVVIGGRGRRRPAVVIGGRGPRRPLIGGPVVIGPRRFGLFGPLLGIILFIVVVILIFKGMSDNMQRYQPKFSNEYLKSQLTIPYNGCIRNAQSGAFCVPLNPKAGPCEPLCQGKSQMFNVPVPVHNYNLGINGGNLQDNLAIQESYRRGGRRG